MFLRGWNFAENAIFLAFFATFWSEMAAKLPKTGSKRGLWLRLLRWEPKEFLAPLFDCVTDKLDKSRVASQYSLDWLAKLIKF